MTSPRSRPTPRPVPLGPWRRQVRRWPVAVAVLAVALVASSLVAQFGRGFRRGGGSPRNMNPRAFVPDFPEWERSSEMPNDEFTFVRLAYTSSYGSKWAIDWPDSDLNFSWRLQQLTSIEVNPNPKVVALADDELFDYPFVYMIEPGEISLTPIEVENLRKYLLNGGFLMVDDFWGTWEWDTFEAQMREVFPDRTYEELELDHEIYSAVFDLKEKPQVPAITTAVRGRPYGVTWEWDKPGSEKVHYRAYRDDDGRIMCVVCWNTDLGDGWEREGENHWYFKEFSEKKAYPMGINIVFYALTH